MKKHSWALFILSGTLGLLLTISSCKKLNEATEIGGGLIPPIDNVNTFDTTLEVQAFNSLFSANIDSTVSNISVSQYLGIINNDPLFGTTEASMFFELLPPSIKNPFPFKRDSLVSLDSIVLVLSYNSTYGDTNAVQQVRVHEINNTHHLLGDSSYSITKNVFSAGQALGPVKSFLPKELNDSVFAFKEKAKNQLRIPLDQSFGMRLINYDSTLQYKDDSAFQTYFNGFAVIPQNNGVANAIMNFSVADTNTKLAVYARYKNGGKIDTAVSYFKAKLSSFSGGYVTGAANYIKRDYTNAAITNAVNSTEADELVYIQNTPGSYATIKVPALPTLNNRVVHRAELIVEQVYHPTDMLFKPPTYLYLDAVDSSVVTNFRTLPYSVQFDPSSNSVNIGSFGGAGNAAADKNSNPITLWQFDVTQYIQRVVNKTVPVYTFRLSSPFYLYEAISLGNTVASEPQYIRINPRYAAGRVRVGGGNHPDQKMRLRIIYSKL